MGVECFRIDSGVRQDFIMSPWLFKVYMDAVKKEVKMGIWRMGVRILEKGDRGNFLSSYMQMTWLCVVNRKGT